MPSYAYLMPVASATQGWESLAFLIKPKEIFGDMKRND